MIVYFTPADNLSQTFVIGNVLKVTYVENNKYGNTYFMVEYFNILNQRTSYPISEKGKLEIVDDKLIVNRRMT